jgi:hypothetical protein
MLQMLRRKLYILGGLVTLLVLLTWLLPDSTASVSIYDEYIFSPFQSARNFLLSIIPFSVGDLLYVFAGGTLLFVVLQWVYFLVRFGTLKHRLAGSVINTINVALFSYLFFLIGWGVNYYKRPLEEHWNIATLSERSNDSAAIVAFDEFLVERLNATAPNYKALPFEDINQRSVRYYRQFTDSKVKTYGLSIKSSLFGFFLERMAVEGYYNPFTGEGQVNKYLPSFILPFVICHEMAHQSGVAAEEDANLMAYTLSTTVADPAFNYSAYLNLWLYTNNRLYYLDSARAAYYKSRLNKLTLSHIDILKQLNKKYHSQLSEYSSDIYDSYLKMQNQKDGIRSYSNVALSAWQLELKRGKEARKELIHLP